MEAVDPARFLPRTGQERRWTFAVEDRPANDRLCCTARRSSFARTARLFAVAVARALRSALVENPDPRSIVAVDVAERHANGEVSGDEQTQPGPQNGTQPGIARTQLGTQPVGRSLGPQPGTQPGPSQDAACWTQPGLQIRDAARDAARGRQDTAQLLL